MTPCCCFSDINDLSLLNQNHIIMKQLTLILSISVGLLIGSTNIKPSTKHLNKSVATCVGADPCKACKNCKYCKRCAKKGLTCGVCKK